MIFIVACDSYVHIVIIVNLTCVQQYIIDFALLKRSVSVIYLIRLASYVATAVTVI